MLSRRSLQLALIAVALIIAVATNLSDDATQDDARTPVSTQANQSADDIPFDFYVLALSWSPAFCASDAGRNANRQCNSGEDYRFITHGLWPQFEDGWPSFCQSPHGDSMPQAVADRLLPIMPSRGLIAHQWDKHGTCSGLSPSDYAQQIIDASQRITMPQGFLQTPARQMDAAEIETAFQRANPAIPGDAIAVSCPSGRLREVRICLDQSLSPRQCRQVDRQGCQQEDLHIEPPAR